MVKHPICDCCTGIGVVRSAEPVTAGEWTKAVVELGHRQGSLVVNDGIASKSMSVLLMTRLHFESHLRTYV